MKQEEVYGFCKNVFKKTYTLVLYKIKIYICSLKTTLMLDHKFT